MNILASLYLGSEPVGVTVLNDQLIVRLADQRALALPLSLLSQLSSDQSLPTTTQFLLLRQPPAIARVHVTERMLNVYLRDGRMLASPLAWFPRLMHGTPDERNHYELSGDDDVIHWPDLDEDIELIRLFEGGQSLESEQSIQRWLRSRQASNVATLAAD